MSSSFEIGGEKFLYDFCANSLAINLAGIATILQLLCCLESSAISGIQASAHLIP
jgi:hypothetical protein